MPRLSIVNWKTSVAGVAMILTSILGIVQHFNDGTPIEVETHVAAIVAGFGFLVANDSDVTGGTRVWKRRNSLTDSERGKGYGEK